MFDLRTLGLAAGAFCATFLVGWWLNIGNLASGIGVSAKPAVEAPVTQAAPASNQKTAVQVPPGQAPGQGAGAG